MLVASIQLGNYMQTIFNYSNKVKFIGNFSNIYSKCLLQIDENGKLLDNGIENFVKSIPAKYIVAHPNIVQELTELVAEIKKAGSACEVGRIAIPVVGKLLATEV